jgi:hypothetical protein
LKTETGEIISKKEALVRDAMACGFQRFEAEAFYSSLKRFAEHTLMNIDPSKFMSWQEGFEASAFKEREACAKVCEQTDDGTPYNLAEACAKAIRARGQE